MNANTTILTNATTATVGASVDLPLINEDDLTVIPPLENISSQEVATVEADTPDGPVEIVFSIRDGILDDLSRVSDSFATMQFLPAMYYAKALGAGLGAAYIGVKLFRFAGVRGPIGATLGAVFGGVVLDAVSKRMVINRVERATNGVAVS